MRKPIRTIATILYQRFTLSRFINYPSLKALLKPHVEILSCKKGY